ncbi:MAG: zf-HC2 domain-containing protein [Deltaproteobacteria bacterium]|nr:zf-HC2 domain-containing protein [Deltaproteobacteria bacterium]MBW2116780.1 zf-HC2 domain-containing protein [Deltaproteobacteria bacterium]
MKEDCKKHFKRISEYLDGELDDRACKEIEESLEKCPECLECLSSLKKSVQLFKEAGEEEMPTEIRKRLRSNLRDCFSNKLK